MRRRARREGQEAATVLAVLAILCAPAACWRSPGNEAAGSPAAQSGAAGAPDVVVLNNRGYNYGPSQPAPLDEKQLEALRAEAEPRGKP